MIRPRSRNSYEIFDRLSFFFLSQVSNQKKRTKIDSQTKSISERVITLQNRAAMSVRLRVLYTDENDIPFLLETGRLFTTKTKSVSVPSSAKHVTIIVDKEVFIDTWHNAYQGLLDSNLVDPCIRIIGTTFKSKVKLCPKTT